MNKFGCLLLLAICRGEVAIAQRIQDFRLTSNEIAATAFSNDKTGSSGVEGIRTKVLAGDPSKSGFYSVLLFVPPNTSIQPHSHAGDRVAAVISGHWYIGYGSRFSTESLKELPPGSVYSEPARRNHFAKTGNVAVIVEISGYGPTDTVYVNPVDDPAAQQKLTGAK